MPDAKFRCGHPKTPDNVLTETSGQTRCKFCRRQRDRERWPNRPARPRKRSGLFFRCGHATIDDNVILDKSKRGKVYKRCATCRRRRDRERATPERVAATKKWVRDTGYELARNRERYFKMSPAEFNALFESQGRRCAACGTDQFSGHRSGLPHVDHDHKCCPIGSETCGKCVRGIICWRCNFALGMVRDDIARLEGMIAYLKRWQAKGEN